MTDYPFRVDVEESIRKAYRDGVTIQTLAFRWSATEAQIESIVRDLIPPVGPTSTGTGELAGGDVQAMPPRPKARRRANRHDQRTPLPGDPGFVRPSVTSDIIRDLLEEGS